MLVEFAGSVVAVGVFIVPVLAVVVLAVVVLVVDAALVLALPVALLCAETEAVSVNKQTATERGTMLMTLLFTVSDSL